MSVIQAKGLKKSFGDVAALDGLDLNVERGRIVGLIGPNGSGKTTAIKSILGMARIDEGHLDVLGFNPARDRKALMSRTAYIADTGILPRWMKVSDLIDFVEGVHSSFNRARAEDALAKTDIRSNKKVQALSKGMHVQLHLALILAIEVELLVLDEPTLGLDILYRQQFYDTLLNDFYEENRSILVTTHEVREIEHILTDVIFINRGRQCLAMEMDKVGAEFVKLNVTPDKESEARARQPLGERNSLQGREFIYRGADQASLAELGEVSTPNLPELFVAVVGDR
jgi:ABC-2 type transport system ATP-binding protein